MLAMSPRVPPSLHELVTTRNFAQPRKGHRSTHHSPITLTVKEHDALLPDTSIALQSTALMPVLNIAPLAGVHATTGVGSALSVAVVVNVARAVASPASVGSRIAMGHVMVGAC